jgi:hypothetical protein
VVEIVCAVPNTAVHVIENHAVIALPYAIAETTASTSSIADAIVNMDHNLKS